jgi:hypothetical protein
MMWDYAAFPLWPVDAISLDELSPSLRADLKDWSDDRTDAMWDERGPDAAGWQPSSDASFAAWDARGRALLARVREELGPAVEVGYFDERTGKVEWPSGGG